MDISIKCLDGRCSWTRMVQEHLPSGMWPRAHPTTDFGWPSLSRHPDLENITTLCLPAHTSAYLQPLDRTVFRPFKLRYNEAVENFLAESPFNLVTKWSWPAPLRKAYEAGITPSNLTAGFRACGIFPWNPLAVPSYAFDRSNLFDIPSLPPNHQPGEHPLTWVLRRVVAGTEQGPYSRTSYYKIVSYIYDKIVTFCSNSAICSKCYSRTVATK